MMNNKSKGHKQTLKWEEGYLKARRNLTFREKRLKKFSIKKDDAVLDFGCGDGLNIQLLKGMGIKNIIGSDISSKLLEKAKINNPKTKFYRTRKYSTPFKNKKFNVVLVDSVFHHIMDYEKILKEIKRILKPGGRLCFSEPHKGILRSMLDWMSERKIAKYVPVLKTRSAPYMEEIEFMKHWLKTEDEFFLILSKLGFKKVYKKRHLLSIIAIYEIEKK